MSDSTADANSAAEKTPTARVSMTKSTAAGRPPVENIKPPRTIDYATAALGVMVVAAIARALLLLGNTDIITAYAIKQNKNAKNPQKNFDVVKAVHQFREGAIFTAVIVGAALLLLAWALRRTRSASMSRWIMLIIFVFTGLPFYVYPTSGLPGAATTAGVVLGLAAIATIGLIFVPRPSIAYFKACRAASMPPGAQARPGLGSLFGPKRPRGGAGGPASPNTRQPDRRNERLDPYRPTTPGKAKAKVRSDTDAVAKGAELARARAKAAGKSRRTAD